MLIPSRSWAESVDTNFPQLSPSHGASMYNAGAGRCRNNSRGISPSSGVLTTRPRCRGRSGPPTAHPCHAANPTSCCTAPITTSAYNDRISTDRSTMNTCATSVAGTQQRFGHTCLNRNRARKPITSPGPTRFNRTRPRSPVAIVASNATKTVSVASAQQRSHACWARSATANSSRRQGDDDAGSRRHALPVSLPCPSLFPFHHQGLQNPARHEKTSKGNWRTGSQVTGTAQRASQPDRPIGIKGPLRSPSGRP